MLGSGDTSVTHHHIFSKTCAGASNWKKWWRDRGFAAGNGWWQAESFSSRMWKSLMCWQSVIARRVAITKWWQLEFLNVASPGEFWYKEHPANKNSGPVYDRSLAFHNFVTTHRRPCHQNDQIIKCEWKGLPLKQYGNLSSLKVARFWKGMDSTQVAASNLLEDVMALQLDMKGSLSLSLSLSLSFSLSLSLSLSVKARGRKVERKREQERRNTLYRSKITAKQIFWVISI